MGWFRLAGEGAFHAKVLMAGNEAYGAWCRGGQWAAEHLTEGFLPVALALAIGPLKIWRKLRDARPPGHLHGLAEEVPGGWQIHDYLDWNPTKAEAEERRAGLSLLRSEAGRRGGRRSADARRAKQQSHADGSNGQANGQANPNQPVNQKPSPSPSPIPSPEGTVLSHSRARAPEAPEPYEGPGLAAGAGGPGADLLQALNRLADEGHRWCSKIRDGLLTQGGRLTPGQRYTLTTILAEQHVRATAPPTVVNGHTGYSRDGPHYVYAEDIPEPEFRGTREEAEAAKIAFDHYLRTGERLEALGGPKKI